MEMFKIILVTVAVSALEIFLDVHTDEIPAPALTLLPKWAEIYNSDNITLKCEIQGSSENWTYKWYKNTHHLEVSDSQLNLMPVKMDDSGDYTCQRSLQGREDTQKSSAVTLKVYAIPIPILTLVSTLAEIYPSEKVTLKCEIQGGSENWTYTWFKNGQILRNSKSQYEFRTTKDDSGEYKCQGSLPNRVDTENSVAVTLKVNEIPRPKLTVDPNWTEFFTSEKITLSCSIEDNSKDWSFQLRRNGRRIKKKSTLSITVNPTDSGRYTCKGKLKKRSVHTKESDPFQLNVEQQPKPLIRRSPDFQVIYTGEQVTFHCEVKVESNWKYLWFKSLNDSNYINTDTSKLNFSIGSAQVNDGGEYWCQVRRRDFRSNHSDSHTLTVKELPHPKLSIESQWTNFYPTEKVTMKCSINGISKEWGYEWFRNGNTYSGDKELSDGKLSIASAEKSDTGAYACRGKHLMRSQVTTSKTKALEIYIHAETPEPEIRKHPLFDVFYTEEKVQFDCSMTGEGWTYHWFKDLNPTEPSTVNPTYSISSASLSHSGAYYCQAKRGDFTIQSKTVNIQVKDRPPAVLSLLTQLSDIMAGNLLTLTCEVTYMDKQWNYTWYENGQELNESSETYTVTATEETIKSEFKCRGIRTERPLYSSLSEGFVANNIAFKRKILLAISGCVVCCILILLIGCFILKFTRKPVENKETVTEDLFFSTMTSKNQNASPLKEYMENKPTELKECEEKEKMFSDCISAVHEDGMIKGEDTPSAETKGLTSFKEL